MPAPARSNERINARVTKAMAEGGPIAVIGLLTEKQIRFVEAYTENFDKDAALIAAGYNVANKSNAGKMAFQMLNHPAIKIAVRHYTEKRVDKAVLSQEFVEYQLLKIANAMEKATLAGDTKSAAVMLRSIEVMGKLLGMFVDRQEITGKDGDAIRIEETNDTADAFTRSITRLAERDRADSLSIDPIP